MIKGLCGSLSKQSVNMVTHNAKHVCRYWCITQTDVYTSQIAYGYVRN